MGYWKDRAIKQASENWDKLVDVEKELAETYSIAINDIEKEIASIYSKYSVDDVLTYADMNKKLNRAEQVTHKRYMNNLLDIAKVTGDERLIKELVSVSDRKELTRLQALITRLEGRIKQLGYEEELITRSWIGDIYKDNYYRTLYEVQTATTVGKAFNLLDERAIKTAINFEWSGEMFSDRIWSNADELARKLKRDITNGIIKGESFQKMAKKIASRTGGGYNNALRVARTETSYVMSESTAEAYKESGVVDKYEFVATLDSRTSSICQSLDGEIFDLEDREVGVNANPIHPNCRSTTVAYLGKREGERIARGLDGETYYVPRDMKYKDWYSKYIVE